jgi:hypothetical protein
MAHPSAPAPAIVATPPRWLPLLTGAVIGLIVLGPGLRSGELLNLDLLAPPELRVPPGVWGLGPALTQRVPLGAFEAGVGAIIGGPAAVKLLIVASIAMAFAGMERLARPASPLARYGVALIYAAGPYAVTRAAVGHLNVLWAIALLPWMLPTLLQPSRSLRRTLLALAVLGIGGTAAGTLGLAVTGIGLAFEAHRRPLRVIGASVLASLPWLLPNLVVLSMGASVGVNDAFVTDAAGPTALARLFAGAGFWVPVNQVGGRGAAVVLAGLAIAAGAVAGRRMLPPSYRRAAVATSVVGLVFSAASSLPGVRAAWDVAVGSPIGAPIREGQRFLVLWLVVALPAAAHGADRLANKMGDRFRMSVTALPLAFGLVLAAPGAWGAEGALRPRTLPAGWQEAARVVSAHPGTTLILPWHLYYTASFADDRNILNPGPDIIGGDTISSYDPEIGGRQEQLDTRPREAARVLEGYRNDQMGAARLAALGVRWVFVPLEYDWSVSGSALANDPGLRPVAVGDGARLYEVRGWKGPLRTPDGQSGDIDGPVAPLRTASAEGGVWSYPGTGGWLRGLHRVPVTSAGLLDVPPGDGPLWYWPAVPIVVGHLLTLAAATAAGVSLARAKRRARRS